MTQTESEKEGYMDLREVDEDLADTGDSEESTEEQQNVQSTVTDTMPISSTVGDLPSAYNRPSKKRKGVDVSKSKVKIKPSKEKERDKEKEPGKSRKPARPESWVWSHFTLDEDCDPDYPRASCNWCGIDYACHKKRNGTSNMAHHLEFKCKKIPSGFRDPKQTVLSFQPKKKEDGEGGGSNLKGVTFEEKDAQFVLDKVGPPTNEDWNNARVFVKFLKVFHDVTKNISGTLFVTSSQYFHDFCLVLNTLNNLCKSDDPLLSRMAERMKMKHDKYWGDVKNINMNIFIAVVLDPRYKFKFVEWSFKKLYSEELAEFMCQRLKDSFSRMYESYKNFHGYGKSQVPHTTNVQSQDMMVDHDVNVSSERSDSFAMEFDKVMNEDDSFNNHSELDLYLMEAREKMTPKFDILNWWKVNSTKFSVIGCIARDILAMPVSTVASESSFSTGGRVLDQYRSSLTPKTVEALICAQNWFRSSPLSYDVEDKVEDIEQMELDLGVISPTDDDDY